MRYLGNHFRNEIVLALPGREMHISNKYNAGHDTSCSMRVQLQQEFAWIKSRYHTTENSVSRVYVESAIVDESGSEWVGNARPRRLSKKRISVTWMRLSRRVAP